MVHVMSESNKTQIGCAGGTGKFFPPSIEQKLMNIDGRLRVLEQCLQAQCLRADTAEALSVTNILMNIVPGEDGMGEEVYAKSISEVQLLIHNLCSETEILEEKLAAAEQRYTDSAAKLTRALDLLRGVHTGDLFGPEDWETVHAFLTDAALNPNPEAESHEEA